MKKKKKSAVDNYFIFTHIKHNYPEIILIDFNPNNCFIFFTDKVNGKL